MEEVCVSRPAGLVNVRKAGKKGSGAKGHVRKLLDQFETKTSVRACYKVRYHACLVY